LQQIIILNNSFSISPFKNIILQFIYRVQVLKLFNIIILNFKLGYFKNIFLN